MTSRSDLQRVTLASSQTSTRWPWLDAAKGLGIALIVWGHIFSINEPTALQVYVYAFHVPLFFFVSGLTFQPQRNTLAQVLRAKAATLLVPYLAYALVGFLFYAAGYAFAQSMGLKIAQFDYGLLPPLIGIFYGSLGDGYLVNTPVWFVIALFCTLGLGQTINQYLPSRVLRLAAALGIAVLGYWVGGQVKLPFSLAPAMLGLFFFQVAVEIKGAVFALNTGKKSPLWALLLIGLVISLFSQVNGFVSQATPAVGNLGWFFLFGFAGTLATVSLAQLVTPIFPWLTVLGRYSLHIMLIHFLIIKSVKVVLSKVTHTDLATIDGSTPLGSIVLIATIALLPPAVYVMKRYLPWTLGPSARASKPTGA